MSTYNDTVIYCEYCELVQSGYEVPASGNVSGNEDDNGKYRERVHQSAKDMVAFLFVWTLLTGLSGEFI